MQLTLSLLVLVALLATWAYDCVRREGWQEPVDGSDERLGSRAVSRGHLSRGHLAPRHLPRGHLPPPGLGPLSPSERFLTSEAARGVRELQSYLDQRTP